MSVDNEQKKLEVILEKNPFREKGLIDGWRKELAKIAEKQDFPYDPDKPEDYKWFCLEEDKERIKKFNEGLTLDTRKSENTKRGHRIHPEFIPQPFIGHPSAKIWLLNINPSWFASDVFAILNAGSNVQELTWRKKINNESLHLAVGGETIPFVDDMRDNVKCLKERQERMLNQLLLEKNTTTFFLLNECFNIVHDKSDGIKDTMYKWWSRCVIGNMGDNYPFGKLLGNNSDMPSLLGESLFVLESNPYRSLNPDKSFIKACLGVNGNATFNPSTEWGIFWKELVCFALATNRTIILRMERKRSETSILRHLFEGCEKISSITATPFFLRTNQRVRLSCGNVDCGFGKEKDGTYFSEVVQGAFANRA